MAKKRSDESAGQDRTDDQQQARAGNADNDAGKRKQPAGRTIGKWKAQVAKELPEGTDEQVAARLRRIAEEEGFDYENCTAATVAKWREEAAREAAEEKEGHAIVVLRQLVRLLGKEGVKKLIDSL